MSRFEYMTVDSHLSKNLRRQPKQDRGREKVSKILDAAAEVFDQMGYEAATTHLIAAKAGTAIGSLYQFFPDKQSIFHAMELRHIDRVKTFWASVNVPQIIALPLTTMIDSLVMAVAEMFDEPVSRVVFVRFYLAREIFQSIDETMTQESINFLASILKGRNLSLNEQKSKILAEVCVHASNAVILSALRNPDLEYRQLLTEEIKSLLVSYLQPWVGDTENLNKINVMKVMKCLHCQSEHLSKNGYRRGKQCYLCKDCRKQFVL